MDTIPPNPSRRPGDPFQDRPTIHDLFAENPTGDLTPQYRLTRFHQRAGMLDLVSQMGMHITREVYGERICGRPSEQPEPAPEPSPEPSLDPMGRDAPANAKDLEDRFVKLSHNLRCTLALDERFEQDYVNPPRRAAASRPRFDPDRTDLITRRRRRDATSVAYDHLERSVRNDRAIPDKERLLRELSERLDHNDIRDMLDNRPVVEIIARICCDFGIKLDCSQFTDEMLAHEFPSEFTGEFTDETDQDPIADPDPWSRPPGPFDHLAPDEAATQSAPKPRAPAPPERESRITWYPVVQPSGNIVSFAGPPRTEPPD